MYFSTKEEDRNLSLVEHAKNCINNSTLSNENLPAFPLRQLTKHCAACDMLKTLKLGGKQLFGTANKRTESQSLLKLIDECDQYEKDKLDILF